MTVIFADTLFKRASLSSSPPFPKHSLIASALAYAAQGWHVLPLHTPDAAGICSCIAGADCGKNTGKHPRVPNGLHDATTREATIREWWQRWPSANVGIRTGTISGLLVIDIDGPAGLESWHSLQRQHGDVGPTVTARTGRGWHLYFNHPGREVKSRAGIRNGLDLRADGGYIVAPPSRHFSGTTYTWEYSPTEVGWQLPRLES
jgi:hypothetical protein